MSNFFVPDSISDLTDPKAMAMGPLLGKDWESKNPFNLSSWKDPWGVFTPDMPDIPNQKKVSSTINVVPRFEIFGGVVTQGGYLAAGAVTGDGNENLNRIYLLGNGELEEITLVIDDEDITLDVNGDATTPSTYAGYVKCKLHYGNGTDAADTDALAGIDQLDVNSKFHKVAYAYLSLKYSDDVWKSDINNIYYKIKGSKLIYDPRTDTTGYSDNPALILAYYLTTSDIGPKINYNFIDEDELIASANVCDELVTLKGGGSENRYRVAMTVSSSDEVEGVVSRLSSAMAGRCYTHNDKIIIQAGYYEIPTFTLSVDNFIKGYSLTNKIKRSERINTVRSKISCNVTNYNPSYAPVRDSSAAITADGEVLSDEIDLTFIPSQTQAQRLAEILLRSSRLQKSLSVTCSIEALRCRANKPINVSLPDVGINGVFMVVSMSQKITDASEIQMDLIEYASSIYDWTAATDEKDFELNEKVQGTLLIDDEVFTGLTISDTGYFNVITDNTETIVTTSILITWSTLAQLNSNSVITVDYKKSSDSIWTQSNSYSAPSLVGTASITIANLEPTTEYDIRLRGVTPNGSSPYTLISEYETDTWNGSVPLPKVDTPVFNPVDDDGLTSIDYPITVTISTLLTGTTIRYSLTSQPVLITDGLLYSGEVSIPENTTLYAMAFKTGYQASDAKSQLYASP